MLPMRALAIALVAVTIFSGIARGAVPVESSTTSSLGTDVPRWQWTFLDEVAKFLPKIYDDVTRLGLGDDLARVALTTDDMKRIMPWVNYLAQTMPPEHAFRVAPLAEELARSVGPEAAASRAAVAAADADIGRLDASSTNRARHVFAAIATEGENAARAASPAWPNEQVRDVAEEGTCFAIEETFRNNGEPPAPEDVVYAMYDVAVKQMTLEQVLPFLESVEAHNTAANITKTAHALYAGDPEAIADGMALACEFTFSSTPTRG
jgi:hypothetical protein